MQEYEQALISCLLNKPELKSYVSEIDKEFFEEPVYGEIFDKIETTDSFPQIIKKLEGKVSFKTLLEYQSLISLVNADNVVWYGNLVITGYKERKLKEVAGLSVDDAEELIKKLKSLDISEKKEKVSDSFLADLERIYEGKPDLSTIQTGFKQMDDLIRGFRNSELIIIGGRPAMGKSTIGMNIAYNMAVSKKKVVFFSLEMAKKELHQRLVKLVTGYENLYNITQQQFEKCITVSKRIEENLSLEIYDKADITVEGIYSTCKKLKDKKEIDCLFIDHLSILKSKKSYKSRYEEISEISRQLKVIAKDLDIPVVCLCQLNRGVESRGVKIPTMADLRDSGSIEQDADLICFIHRPEYYALQKNEEVSSEDKGKAILSICKNRRGGVGCVEFMFNPKIPSFY